MLPYVSNCSGMVVGRLLGRNGGMSREKKWDGGYMNANQPYNERKFPVSIRICWIWW